MNDQVDAPAPYLIQENVRGEWLTVGNRIEKVDAERVAQAWAAESGAEHRIVAPALAAPATQPKPSLIDLLLTASRAVPNEQYVEVAAAVDDVADLVAELDKAHQIIGIALNCLHGEAKRKFVQRVCDAGLDGDGVTRANERAALLVRVGSTA